MADVLPVTPATTLEARAAGSGRSRLVQVAGALCGLAAVPLLWFAPLHIEPRAQHAVAVTALMIIFWISECIPHFLTGLLGCWLFWTLGIAPPRVAFGGFVNEAPWFLIGSLILGLVVTETGLAKRLAYSILSWVGTSYRNILLGLILTDFLMTFMIPAGPPRIILLGSIVLGVVASFGLDRRSNVARGAILAVTFSATLFDKTIIGSTPSILARSLIQEYGRVPVYWTQWFIAYFPLDVVNIIGVWWLIVKLYPPEVMQIPGGNAFLREQKQSLGPWSAREKRGALLAAAAVGLWATDFLHNLSPAVIGLGTGILAAIPAFGLLKPDDMKRVNYGIFFFMGTAISMGEVLGDTKALQMMSGALFQFLSPYIHNVLHSTLVLYWSAFAAHLVLASETAMIAATMPLVMNYGVQNHLNPVTLGLVWSFATGGKLFIYQSLVLIAGYSFGCFNARDVFRIGLFVLIAESIFMLLIVPLYWPLLGIS